MFMRSYKNMPTATATVVRSNNESARFAIRDLSPGGARLVGELHVHEGERLRLQIELAEPIEIDAEVTLVDQQRKLAEVAFRGVAGDALAQIERAIGDLLTRVRDAAPATVLIIHPSVEVSSALERDLARIDVGARVLASSADLAWQLQDKSTRFVGAIVSGMLPDVGDALDRVERHDPALRRIVLFGEQIERLDHPALSRVHALLRTPWRFKGLARSLEVPMDRVVTTYDQLVALKAEDE
jgi:hypothetical protein